MSNITPQEIKKEFFKSKMGIAGITILTILILTSIITIVIIPIETFQEWNNPESWITYPKAAIPIWVNLFLTEKIPEHKILAEPNIETMFDDEINLTSYQFNLDFNYDQFPKDFIYSYLLEYSGSPLLQMSVIRPDGVKLEFEDNALDKIADEAIKTNVGARGLKKIIEKVLTPHMYNIGMKERNYYERQATITQR